MFCYTVVTFHILVFAHLLYSVNNRCMYKSYTCTSDCICYVQRLYRVIDDHITLMIFLNNFIDHYTCYIQQDN